MFFFAEIVIMIFYCVGTTFTINGHTWSKN